MIVSSALSAVAISNHRVNISKFHSHNFEMQKLREINVLHLPKELLNDYNEVERIGENLRSILRVNDFTKPRLRPLSSSFGSVVRILRSFLVISSMWRPFSILKPMPTFSRKKVLFLLVQCCQLLFHTVWKLQNFSVIQNLREIKVGEARV